MIILWIGTVIIYAAMSTCFAFAVKWLHGVSVRSVLIMHCDIDITSENFFDKQLNTCILTAKPVIVAGVWGILVRFNLIFEDDMLTETISWSLTYSCSQCLS